MMAWKKQPCTLLLGADDDDDDDDDDEGDEADAAVAVAVDALDAPAAATVEGAAVVGVTISRRVLLEALSRRRISGCPKPYCSKLVTTDLPPGPCTRRRSNGNGEWGCVATADLDE